ncbi:hypothetical protein Tsubulata_009419 [Turnera subulata]|uniref:Uncharacterized protein n=1 Tax=Turnera subulata TaxID=218843 RepID=A0A9Q0G1Y7_9ROSI|nr:hypothetical protein Tsubulata_009419 [Turnera subulata]
MGSLMAGWDSPVPDHKSGKYKKNWSFTKGEIEAYWKLKKKIEEEHLSAISSGSDTVEEGDTDGASLLRSSSLPLAQTRTGFMDKETGASLEELIKKNGWWTRSNWAFLNEPPALDRPSNTYSSQFHIANQSNTKAERGITT